MTPEQTRAGTALVLIRRLIQHQGLTAEEAAAAVAQVHRGDTGPHTRLVAEEAASLMREAFAPIHVFMEALRPAAEAIAPVMAQLGRALRAAVPQPVNAPARTRPPWASPYGPPPRRRLP
ncbi:hypothetical protein GCM10010387_16130 [Streptomyces inusitatus]|uniref:Uncharacterized protein n=1 Tax=Streptomyces inusitatus TaxID=68221 RepID=A0A918UNZ2_9ACTN|nr:hypothetical protein [Streptomyces inusitatus]GGZ23697.1 hypothetical protein GCM10010387_16130 [Streptomyces inusitatus]